jgi:DNA-binding transcriptional MerR regulator
VQAEQFTYSVSEAARRLGLSADWLREGERRGVLPPARRTPNGHRFYTTADLELLERMGVGQHPHRLKSANEVLEAVR